MEKPRTDNGAGSSLESWGCFDSLNIQHRGLLEQHDRVRQELEQAMLAKDSEALRQVWAVYRVAVADLYVITLRLEQLQQVIG
jgi:hypothetical protein